MRYNLFNSSGERSCYLCLRIGQQWTGEHVTPQWLSDWLLPRAGHLVFSWEEDGITERGVRFPWEVGVCDPCNQWMENWFEDPNERVLKALADPGSGSGAVDGLTRSQQMHLAGWLFKTCIMEDAYHYGISGQDPRAPREEIDWLYRLGTPSLTTTIWMGQLERNFTGEPTPLNTKPKDELVAQVVVPTRWGPMLTIYRLFVLIVCQRPGGYYRPIDLPVEAEACLTRIWPANEDKVSWPPSVGINRQSYDALRQMVVYGPWSMEPEEPRT